MSKTSSPVSQYKTIIDESEQTHTNRMLVGTAATGSVRMEWVMARYGQIIPMNWSHVNITHFMDSYIPMRYQVADAQNLICKVAIEREMEWLLLYEHDVIPPPDAFVKINQHILEEKVPVVSGLYFVRGRPSNPLVFRGRGTSVYLDWEMGDAVWVDGVPTGLLLVHMGIIREMWADSEEYQLGPQVTRRVFHSPRDQWYDPENEAVYYATVGTSDLAWCTRVMKEGYFKKAGWDKYQDMKYPFLIDTRLFCRHIDPDGTQYPFPEDLTRWQKNGEIGEDEKEKETEIPIADENQMVREG